MKGLLTITVTDDQVQVQGHLSDSNLVDRLAIVDALMNAFDMKGVVRELACKMLLSADKASKEMTPDKLVDALENLLKVVKEVHKDEG